jgi:Fur family peroxide stress response transcriptional regulator
MARKRSGGKQPNIASQLQDTFKDICRTAGIKVTHQRLEIFRILAEARGHPAAEDVFEQARAKIPTISLDTVYRTLATLEQHGVLAKVLVGARIRYDPNTDVHHHFVCTECRIIEDFYWPAFDRKPLPPKVRRYGRITARRVELKGVCPACVKKRKGRKGQRME